MRSAGSPARISSDSPNEYASAVSTRFTPASTARSAIDRASASSTVEIGGIPDPNVIAPSDSSETSRSAHPSLRRLIRGTYPMPGNRPIPQTREARMSCEWRSCDPMTPEWPHRPTSTRPFARATCPWSDPSQWHAATATVAEDAVQDAFERAFVHWRRIARYDDPAGWIRHVALNRLRDHLPSRPAQEASGRSPVGGSRDRRASPRDSDRRRSAPCAAPAAATYRGGAVLRRRTRASARSLRR